jgi:hypothetical protein
LDFGAFGKKFHQKIHSSYRFEVMEDFIDFSAKISWNFGWCTIHCELSID